MITSIALRSFKAFENVAIPIRPLTLLSGVNGSGKSTILQSLGVLKQSFDAGCLTARGGLLLNGEYVDLGVGKDVLFEHSNSQEISIEIADSEGLLSLSFAYAENDDLLQFFGDFPGSFEVPRWLSGGFHFLRADRIAPAVVYPKSFNETVRRRSLGVRGQYTPYFLAVNQDESVAEARMRSEISGGRLLDQVNAWLGEISPGVSVSASEIRGADLAQLLFRYGGSAGLGSSNDYRPTNVGFGLTYILPIIVACLSAKAGDILLIENPEAHLHPRGQSSMGELIARAARDGVQMIVESHSDHLLNGIRLAVRRGLVSVDDVQLHFCTREAGSRGSVFLSPSMDKNGRLSDWPDGFFDEWERLLMELV